MARFAFRVASSFFLGRGGEGRGEGGDLIFHFILSKIVVSEDRRRLRSGILTAIDAPSF